MSCEMHGRARRLFVEKGWATESITDEQIDDFVKRVGDAGKVAAEAMKPVFEAVVSVGRALTPVLVELKKKYPEAFEDKQVDLEERLKEFWRLDGRRKELIEELQEKGVVAGIRLAIIEPDVAIPELEQLLEGA